VRRRQAVVSHFEYGIGSVGGTLKHAHRRPNAVRSYRPSCRAPGIAGGDIDEVIVAGQSYQSSEGTCVGRYGAWPRACRWRFRGYTGDSAIVAPGLQASTTRR